MASMLPRGVAVVQAAAVRAEMSSVKPFTVGLYPNPNVGAELTPVIAELRYPYRCTNESPSPTTLKRFTEAEPLIAIVGSVATLAAVTRRNVSFEINVITPPARR
jgi:hypothetical protein